MLKYKYSKIVLIVDMLEETFSPYHFIDLHFILASLSYPPSMRGKMWICNFQNKNWLRLFSLLIWVFLCSQVFAFFRKWRTFWCLTLSLEREISSCRVLCRLSLIVYLEMNSYLNCLIRDWKKIFKQVFIKPLKNIV